MSRKCCGRKNVSAFEYTDISPALSLRMRDTFSECKALGIDPEAEVLCGDCRQKLMGKHRQLGGKAIVSRDNMAKLMGREGVKKSRGRWQRDEV